MKCHDTRTVIKIDYIIMLMIILLSPPPCAGYRLVAHGLNPGKTYVRLPFRHTTESSAHACARACARSRSHATVVSALSAPCHRPCGPTEDSVGAGREPLPLATRRVCVWPRRSRACGRTTPRAWEPGVPRATASRWACPSSCAGAPPPPVLPPLRGLDAALSIRTEFGKD